jgi:hypothetical protein
MPTTESSVAFDKLVRERTCLSKISAKLKEAHELRSSVGGEERYRALQTEWDEAFRAFQRATDVFSAIVHRIHPA